jgi:signal peptidase I
VAAATILEATLALPVLQISGTSMSPTLAEGQIVVALKGSGYTTGDVVAINYGSRVLVKRIIAGPGQWVNITSDGTVYVDGVAIDEDYITDKSLGKCDITLPYQVPDDSWFVMGDHRETSVDSRSASVGSIASGDIVGKIILRVWPFNTLGRV